MSKETQNKWEEELFKQFDDLKNHPAGMNNLYDLKDFISKIEQETRLQTLEEVERELTKELEILHKLESMSVKNYNCYCIEKIEQTMHLLQTINKMKEK